jgi:hypothetical protein
MACSAPGLASPYRAFSFRKSSTSSVTSESRGPLPKPQRIFVVEVLLPLPRSSTKTRTIDPNGGHWRGTNSPARGIRLPSPEQSRCCSALETSPASSKRPVLAGSDGTVAIFRHVGVGSNLAQNQRADEMGDCRERLLRGPVDTIQGPMGNLVHWRRTLVSKNLHTWPTILLRWDLRAVSRIYLGEVLL